MNGTDCSCCGKGVMLYDHISDGVNKYVCDNCGSEVGE